MRSKDLAVKLVHKKLRGLYGHFWACMSLLLRGDILGILKKQSRSSLIAGLQHFEDSKNAVKKADYGDLKAFVNDFLNTSDKKQRKKLAEEFKKRHLELYEFLENNAELISAESHISKTISDISNPKSDNSDIISKLDEVLGGIKDEF